jgi:hypothetical protein
VRPNVRAEYTRGRPLLPLEKLTTLTLTSPEYQDEERVQVFYSESWGLVHSLLVGPAVTDRRYRTNAERGKTLQQFLALLEKGRTRHKRFATRSEISKMLKTNSVDISTLQALNSLVIEKRGECS